MLQRKTLTLALILGVALAGCGRDDAAGTDEAVETTEAEATDTEAAPAEAAPADAAETEATTESVDADAFDRPLVASDVEAYVRGVRHEMEIAKPTVEKVKAARAKQDTNAETAALLELAAGYDQGSAEAAGLAPERYRHVHTSIDEVLAALQMGEALKPQLAAMEAADLSAATEEQKAEHAKMVAELKAAWAEPYAKLPAEVAEAMKAREAELKQLYAEAMALRFSVL